MVRGGREAVKEGSAAHSPGRRPRPGGAASPPRCPAAGQPRLTEEYFRKLSCNSKFARTGHFGTTTGCADACVKKMVSGRLFPPAKLFYIIAVDPATQ